MNFREKLQAAIEKNLKPQELFKTLCPLQIDFKLKLFADRNNHDLAILLQITGDKPFIEDPRDLQAFLTQVTADRNMNMTFVVTRVKYEDEVYECIYLDFKKEQTKNG